MHRPKPNWLRVGLVLPVAWGIFEAYRLHWICDDIFISFRYISQWFSGNGLVFNPGERVEGFTHFLWLVLLAALHRLGFDLVWLGKYLSIVAFACILWVLFRRAWQRAGPGRLALPLAAWCVSLHLDAQIYATSGLETSMFGLLVLLGTLVTTSGTRHPGLGGVLYALATLTRPEGFLYTAIAGIVVVWRERSLRDAGVFLSTWLFLVVPFIAFRLAYYGEWLPNTYYAKSGGEAYWSQGWHYTRLYFGTYWVLLLALAAIPVRLFLGVRSRLSTTGANTAIPGAALLASAEVLATIVYVTRVGGDFMFARFYVPVTPLLFLVLEDVVFELGNSMGRRRLRLYELGMAIALVALTLHARVLHSRTFPGCQKPHGIANERNCYPEELVRDLERKAAILGRALRATEARVGLLGAQDALAYHANLLYALEPYGLTDAQLARKPLKMRGRPGHEHIASYDDFYRRKVHIRLHREFPVHLGRHQQIRFEDLYGEIVVYDETLMQQLRHRPGVEFVEFASFLDAYVQQLERTNSRRLLEDYAHFQLFYFMHNDRPDLFGRYRRALRDGGVRDRDLAEADAVLAPLRRTLASTTR